MTWIETFSGKRFDLLNPKPDQVDVRDIAHALARLNRFTGHTAAPYSVAEHALHVEWCVREIHRGDSLLNAFALHHDDAEAYVGDVSAPLKAALRAMVDRDRDQDLWGGPTTSSPLDTIETAIQACILRSLSLPQPTVEQRAVIKEADLWCLAAERAVLMPHTGGHEWFLKAEPPPELVSRIRNPYWRHCGLEEIESRFLHQVAAVGGSR